MTRRCWLTEVSACTHAATGYVAQARAHSGPVQDVPCGVQIAIDSQPAMRTVVLPVTEFLRHFRAASGTILTRVTRIHLDQPDTSFCSFISEKRDELGPRRVVDILGKTATRESLHLEGFDRDDVVVTYQSRACLVEVVRATTGRCSCPCSTSRT